MSRSTLGRDVIIAILLAGLGVIAYQHHTRKPAAPAVQSLPNVTTHSVETKTVTAAAIPLVVKDPADQALIKQLLAEAASYKIQVQTLAAGQAESTSTGKLVTVTPVHPDQPEPTFAADAPTPHFTAEDYRLHIEGEGSLAHITYTLKQHFLVLSISGRDQQGRLLNDVKLFETGSPAGNKEIPIVVNNAVVDETVPHWLTGFSVQAGGAITDRGKGYVAALQWLKKGRTDNPKDLRWAALSPGWYAGQGKPGLLLLPVSANVATMVKHQPLTNVWISPVLGIDLQSPGRINRLGVAVTATY